MFTLFPSISSKLLDLPNRSCRVTDQQAMNVTGTWEKGVLKFRVVDSDHGV
jgi:hypothetical protein